MKIFLERPRGFDLAATVTSHGWYRLAPFEWNPDAEILRHIDVLDGNVVRLSLRASARRIQVDVSGRVPRDQLVERVRRMLQLDLDLTDFHQRCRESKILADLPDRGLGRLLCAPSIFEDATKIILTTNTRWARTVDMNERLVEHFGPRSKAGRAFPRPSDLARRSESEIRELGKVGYRARSIHRLATELADGTIALSERPDPATADYATLHDWYLQLPGIGPYGAAHLMAMDGRHDRIAVDTEFRAWVRTRYHGGRRVKDSTLLRHYRHWGPWKYVAYWCEMLTNAEQESEAGNREQGTGNR